MFFCMQPLPRANGVDGLGPNRVPAGATRDRGPGAHFRAQPAAVPGAPGRAGPGKAQR